MHPRRKLSLLPMRGSVLFPGAEMPIYVGRESTIRAINYAKSLENSEIAVFTQTNHENPGPLGRGDIHQVGTICRIIASVELKDQTMKVMLEGLERIRMIGLKDENEVSIVAVEESPEIVELEKKMPVTLSQEFLKLLEIWNPAYNSASELMEFATFRESRDMASAVRALRILTAKPRIYSSIEEKEISRDPAKISADVNKLINEAVLKRIRVFEEPDFRQQLVLLKNLIEHDIAGRTRSNIQ